MRYLFTEDYVSTVTNELTFDFKKGQILNVKEFVVLDNNGKIVFGIDSPHGEMHGMVID